mmetsp:Transcript_17115/g.40864  ORF Transcript_17115/g.40864 Transcript_17115/m.40864 type:complete len:200 (-) Transcript_17115:605-1204(-)
MNQPSVANAIHVFAFSVCAHAGLPSTSSASLYSPSGTRSSSLVVSIFSTSGGGSSSARISTQRSEACGFHFPPLCTFHMASQRSGVMQWSCEVISPPFAPGSCCPIHATPLYARKKGCGDSTKRHTALLWQRRPGTSRYSPTRSLASKSVVPSSSTPRGAGSSSGAASLHERLARASHPFPLPADACHGISLKSGVSPA